MISVRELSSSMCARDEEPMKDRRVAAGSIICWVSAYCPFFGSVSRIYHRNFGASQTTPNPSSFTSVPGSSNAYFSSASSSSSISPAAILSAGLGNSPKTADAPPLPSAAAVAAADGMYYSLQHQPLSATEAVVSPAPSAFAGIGQPVYYSYSAAAGDFMLMPVAL